MFCLRNKIIEYDNIYIYIYALLIQKNLDLTSHSGSKLSKYPSTGIYLDLDRVGIRVFKFGYPWIQEKQQEL